MGLFHIHTNHSINTRAHPTTPRLGKVYKRALVVPSSFPHQRAFVCGACIGTAQVGVSLVSLFGPLFKRSRLHCFDICMSICMCVCSSTCLHRCMFMLCTHNTHMHAHIHAHTTHTPHHYESSTQLFFHQYLSQSWAETSELLGRISTSELDPQSFCFFLRFVLYFCVCAHVCIRVYFQ